MPKTLFSKKLIRAREGCGLTLYQAAQRMGNTSFQVLWHLEGRSKAQKAPRSEKITFATAVDIVCTYWPAIQVSDIYPECRTLEFSQIEDRA